MLDVVVSKKATAIAFEKYPTIIPRKAEKCIYLNIVSLYPQVEGQKWKISVLAFGLTHVKCS